MFALSCLWVTNCFASGKFSEREIKLLRCEFFVGRSMELDIHIVSVRRI
jgi:hypothetical protein